MRKSVFIFSLCIGTILLLTVVHVVVANILSTTGVELDQMQTELTKYEKENVILHEEVLKRASLFTIASVAAEMGFVPSKSVVSIQAPLPIARR